MARSALILGATGLAVLTLTACDAGHPRPTGANPRQVTVVGQGQVQGIPDTLTADVGIESTANDVTTAMNKTNDQQRAVIDALTHAGMDRKDIRTAAVNLEPQYAGQAPGGSAAILGYRASNSITITMHPADTASRMLALIVDAGGDATRIHSVSYSIADDSALLKDARARAFDDARHRAEQYAQLSGLRLGPVLSISEESTAGRPQPQSPRALATQVPLEPGQQTVGFTVTAVWELD